MCCQVLATSVKMPQFGAMASKGVDCALETLKEFTDEVVLAVVHEFHLRQRHWQLVHIYAHAAGVWPVIPWRPGLSVRGAACCVRQVTPVT